MVPNWERSTSRLYIVTLLIIYYVEYNMQNAGLNEAQDEIKIAGRNINNIRYADNTTLMAESEEELKSHLMKMKEECEKAGLKLNIQKTKIMASSPITSWQIDGETMETVTALDTGLHFWARSWVEEIGSVAPRPFVMDIDKRDKLYYYKSLGFWIAYYGNIP